MARRRRKQSIDVPAIVGIIVLFLVIGFVSEHPWILAVGLAVAGAYVYWRWWYRPHQQDVRTRRFLRAEEEAELAREERAYVALRERSQTLGGLLTLTPREFEIRIADILSEYGYDDVEHVGRARDLGIDIFATDPDGERVGIQCKRYALEKLVRAPEVRLLYGDTIHAGVHGVFVTTSDFTTDARAYAESHGITLINGQRLMQLVSTLRAEEASQPEILPGPRTPGTI